MNKPALLVMLVLGLSACGGSQTVTPTDVATACQQEEFALVSVPGYLRLFQDTATVCRGDECDIALYSQPGAQGELMTACIDATAQPDSGENAIEPLPQSYRPEDLRIHTSSGDVIGPDTLVTLEGYIKREADLCFLSVTVIDTP